MPKSSSSKSKPAQQAWKQLAGLLLLLAGLIVVALVTGLMVFGVIDVGTKAKAKVNSMTDAMFVCDAEIEQRFGADLQSSALDDLSSRSSSHSDGYQLYYDLTMYRDKSRNTGVDSYFVNCNVSAKGRVSQIEFLQNKNSSPKASRPRGGNAIGL